MFAFPLAFSPVGVASAAASAVGMALLFFFLLFGLTWVLVVPIPRRVACGTSRRGPRLVNGFPRLKLADSLSRTLGPARDEAQAEPVAS